MPNKIQSFRDFGLPKNREIESACGGADKPNGASLTLGFLPTARLNAFRYVGDVRMLEDLSNVRYVYHQREDELKC